MTNLQKPKHITLEEYRALLNTISDASTQFITQSIEAMMPEEHTDASALFSVVLHIATKAICMICSTQEDRKKGSDFFCENLQKLTEEAIIIPVSHINQNKH